MKKIIFKGKMKLVLTIFTLIFSSFLFGQNGIIGAGFTNGWGTSDIISFDAGAGTSRIKTLNPKGTGNQFFRLVRNWSGDLNQFGPFGCVDLDWTNPGVIYGASTCNTSGAFFINCPNTTDNYVFKTPNGNSSTDLLYFRIQGAVQSVSSVSRTPSSTIPVNMPVTITATTSGSLSSGQAVYLRYTTNSFSTSTVVQMSGSGTSYTATIPGQVASTNVSYYVFTSGTANVASNGSNADLYTINLNNNSGTNYSYTTTSTTANVWVTSTGGTGAAGAAYTTLSAAFTAINAGTHTGVINVTILANTTEPADPVDLLRSNTPSSYTSIVIKPSGNRTITGSGTTTNTSVIDLLGADNVTIDGDDPSTSGLQNLTITQPTSTNRIKACIKIASNSTTGTDGANNITIKNCIIVGSRASATAIQVNYGIVMTNGATLSTGSYSSLNVLIENNNITRCWNAIHANGVSATYPNTGLQILNNTIGTPSSGTFADATTVGFRGILLTYTAVSSGGAIIRGNDIRVGVSTTGYLNTIAGIEVGTVNYGFVIDKNNIHDIVQPNTGGYGAHGIYITGSTNNTISTISNNFIRDVKMVVYQQSSTSTFIPAGIFFTAGATGVNIVNNTIVLGTQLGSGSNFSSFGVNASVAGVRIAKFLNNNIVNEHSSTWAFGLYCNANLNISGGTINNNNYYVPNTGHVGYYNAANRTTLAAWQTETSQDSNSYNVNPSFVSATDLHLNTTGNSNFESTGAVVGTSGVSDDYDSQTRPGPTGSVNGGGTAPDIGADEFDGVPLILCTTPSAQPTAFVAGVITQNSIAGSFTAATGTPSGYLVVRSPGALSANPVNGTTYAAGATLGNGTIIQSGSTLSFAPTGLISNTAYTITIYSFNGGSCSGGPVYLTTSPLTGTLTTCAATPTLPTATSITTSGATIGWTASAAGGGAGTISYTVNVFTDAARTIHAPNSPYASTTSVSQTVTGLSAATTYYYRIVASNGSCNSGNLDDTFTTACASLPITQNQGFNAATAPTCWNSNLVLVQTGTKISYLTSGTNPTTSPQEGTHMVRYNSFSNTNGGSGSEERLVSVPLSSIGTNSVDIEFYLRNENSTSYNSGAYLNEGVQVQYSTDGTTWTNAGSFFPRYDSSLASGVAQWNLKTVTVPSALANLSIFYVALKFRSEYGNNIFIDNVTVKPSPSCLNNTVSTTTAITSTTATINWTASSSSPTDGYEWEVRSSGNGGTGATGLATSGTVAAGVLSANVTGLTANTSYTVWVRANCGAGGYSQWVSGGSFTTLCDAVNVPYIQNFESVAAGTIPTCTQVVQGGSGNLWTTINNPFPGFTSMTLRYIYNASNAANTWYFIQGLNLTAGVTYRLSYLYGSAYSPTNLFPENLKVAYGTSNTVGAMTNILADHPNITVNNQTNTVDFTPSSTGVYYIGFQAYSLADEDRLFLDDISVTLAPEPITITPATTTTICSGGSVQLTASSTAAYTYTWSPSTGLNTTTGATVTANPTTTTTYTVTGNNGAGMIGTQTITVTVNPAQPDLVITNSDATVCKNTVQELTVTGGTVIGATVTASSGTVNLTIPDGNLTTGASQNLTVNGIPANVTITNVNVSLDITHTWLSDLRINLEAPNGQIINLINQRGGDSDNFTNTIVTSNTGAASLSTGSAPFTGTFTADIENQTTIGTTPAVTTTTFSNLFATPNGTWKVRVYDDESIISGTLNNCSITITYDGGVITWSPTTDLYTNATCTAAYSGGHATNLWSKPTATRTYTATSTLGSCEKIDTVTLTVESAIHNGTSWSSAPAANKEIVFNGNFSSTDNLEGCSCTISSGNIVINSNHTLKLLDEITVNGGSMTFENNSSLIQINDVANTGNITYKRTSPQTVEASDYVYWSSPVSGQTVPSGTNYFWNNAAGSSGNWVSAVNQSLTAGKGVIMRGVGSRTFTGVPHNGEIMANVHRRNLPGYTDNWNLIGNPYPSAISADEFLADLDNAAIEGSIAIWTHNSPISSTNDDPFYNNFTYNYNPNDYIIYNLSGSQLGPESYYGFIPAGQAFFVKYDNDDNASPTAASSTIKFKNSMRLDASGNTYNNSQFYRNSGNVSQNIEKSRIWIDIINGSNAFNRTVVGYIENATDGKDRLYDSTTKTNTTTTSIYSLIGNSKMGIQGKGLPFMNSDIIPLGFNAAQAGNLTIAIHELDGLFVNQEVYLLDTQLNIIHDIKLSPYTFTTTQGENNSRFQLIFNNETLSNPDFDAQKSVFIVNENKLEVISNLEQIEAITVFDLLGRTIYMKDNINNKEFVIPVSKEHAPLIVKIKLANGTNVERKTLY